MEKNQSTKKNHFKTPWIQSTGIIVVVFGLLALFLYWSSVKNTIFIENSYLDAPVANIAPNTSGMLNAVYVKEGDEVKANSPLALVGSETIYSKNGGVVTKAPKVLGSYYPVGQTVISVVDESQMEVVGSVEETKGLKEIETGQRAKFVVDAFSGKTYEGTVSQVNSVSDSSSVVFSISDKRPVKKFSVHVRFDHNKYPELKSGMSAKITVYTEK